MITPRKVNLSTGFVMSAILQRVSIIPKCQEMDTRRAVYVRPAMSIASPTVTLPEKIATAVTLISRYQDTPGSVSLVIVQNATKVSY